MENIEDKLAEAKQLDQPTFKALFEAYYQQLKNYVYYKIKDSDKAEDIAQDAFVKLWEKRKQVRMETVKVYLFTIANNMTLNEIKHQSVVMSFVSKSKPARVNESPQYLIEEREFDQKLKETISAMPERSRVVFLMKRMDGMTYHEIADKLELSVKAIEKRMKKALDILKDAFPYKI